MSPLTAVRKNSMFVTVGDMKISEDPGSVLKTYALGTCIGVSAYDVHNRIGGLLHFQLPDSRNHENASNPFMFADTGLPLMLNTLFDRGACRRSLVIRAAGGADVAGRSTSCDIARRNILILKKILWKNGLLLDAEDLGGTRGRNMTLEIGSGRVIIKRDDNVYELRQGVA